MFIQVDHITGISCFEAVVNVLLPMEPGDHITVDGMAMGDRIIHAEVVKALIHAARDSTMKNYRAQVEPSGDGWSNVMHVVCTGRV
jgi:hypothetical protein